MVARRHGQQGEQQQGRVVELHQQRQLVQRVRAREDSVAAGSARPAPTAPSVHATRPVQELLSGRAHGRKPARLRNTRIISKNVQRDAGAERHPRNGSAELCAQGLAVRAAQSDRCGQPTAAHAPAASSSFLTGVEHLVHLTRAPQHTRQILIDGRQHARDARSNQRHQAMTLSMCVHKYTFLKQSLLHE
jgi:hypothetical protein